MNRLLHSVQVDGYTMPPARPFFRRTPSTTSAFPATMANPKKHRATTASSITNGDREKGTVQTKKRRSNTYLDGKNELPSHSSEKNVLTEADNIGEENNLEKKSVGKKSALLSAAFPVPPCLQRSSPLDEMEAEIARAYRQELEQILFGDNKLHSSSSSPMPTSMSSTTKHSTIATDPSPPCHHSSPHGLSPSPEAVTQEQQRHYPTTSTMDRDIVSEGTDVVSEGHDTSIRSESDIVAVGGDDDDHYDSICVDGGVGVDVDGVVRGDISPISQVPAVDDHNSHDHQLQLPFTVTDKLQLYRQLWQQRSIQSQHSLSSATSPSFVDTTSTVADKQAYEASPINHATTTTIPTTFSPMVSPTKPFEVEEICVEEECGGSTPIESAGSATPSSVDCATPPPTPPPPATHVTSTTTTTAQLLVCHHQNRLDLEKEVVRRLSFEFETEETTISSSFIAAASARREEPTTLKFSTNPAETTTMMATPTRPLIFDDTASDEVEKIRDGVGGGASDTSHTSAEGASPAPAASTTAPAPLGETTSPNTPLFNDEEEWCIADGQRMAGEMALSELHLSDPPAAASTPSPLCVSPLLDPQSWLYNGSHTASQDERNDSGNAIGVPQLSSEQFGSLNRYVKWAASTTIPSMGVVSPRTTDTGCIHLTNKCGRVLTILPITDTTTTTHLLRRRRRTPKTMPIPSKKAPYAKGPFASNLSKTPAVVVQVSEEASFTPEAELHWAATLDVFRDMNL